MLHSSRTSLRRTLPTMLLALLAGAAALPNTAAAQVCGDLNASGEVTTSDALSLLRFSVGQPVELVCGGDCEVIEPRVEALETSLATAQAVIAELVDLLDGVERDGDTLVFSGMNLQVVDGTGGTAGVVNGTGNLVIGYNEASEGQLHTGSHNLVVGPEHEYTSFAGIVAGEGNTISGRGATVVGGTANVASAANSSVAAGFDNQANGIQSAVSGGCENVASSQFAAVSGGQKGTASAMFSSVTGGYLNKATALHAAVSGGNAHTASGPYDWRAGTLFEDQ